MEMYIDEPNRRRFDGRDLAGNKDQLVSSEDQSTHKDARGRHRRPTNGATAPGALLVIG